MKKTQNKFKLVGHWTFAKDKEEATENMRAVLLEAQQRTTEIVEAHNARQNKPSR